MRNALIRGGAFAAALLGVAAARAEEAFKPETVAELKAKGFVELFDGKTLAGWKALDNPDSWTVTPEGTIKGKGPASHLFTVKEYEHLEFRAEVRTQLKTNSGMYFRTKMERGFPTGYEAQVNCSHRDPVKTGSLYNIAKNLQAPHADNEWFVQHIVAQGDRIVIKVNGKVIVDVKNGKHQKGHIALQQHDPGSVVEYRNLMVKELAAP
jgi:hypothetical protein